MNELCERCSRVQVASGSGWKAYLGDAYATLAQLPADSVDAVITDPPYATGANQASGRAGMSSVDKYRSSGAKPMVPIDGDSLLPEQWSRMMGLIMREAWRVAAPGAIAVCFCDWRNVSVMSEVLGRSGWATKGLAVWDKGRGSRPIKNGFRLQTELILWSRKAGGCQNATSPPVYLDGVLRCNLVNGNVKEHLTQKPIALMRELMRLAPAGGVVLDPFQGAGTTGVAALEAGLQYIGMESVAHYHGIACARLAAAEAARA